MSKTAPPSDSLGLGKKLWSEIEVSDDEYEVDPEVAREELRMACLHPSQRMEQEAEVAKTGSSGPRGPPRPERQRGGNVRREKGRNRAKRLEDDLSCWEVPKPRRGGGGRSSEMTRSAELSRSEVSTNKPRVNRFAAFRSIDALYEWTPKKEEDTITSPSKLLSDPIDPPPAKQTDNAPPLTRTERQDITLEAVSRPTSNIVPTPDEVPVSGESSAVSSDDEEDFAKPDAGRMTETDDDVVFDEPFDIWYTLPQGQFRNGLKKEAYEGGMHKIGTFTKVSAFFEFHEMLDWTTLPANSVIAFCREGVKPIWEDPHNELGGRFLVKGFMREEAEAVFTKTALGFFSGMFHDWKGYNLVSLHIREPRRGIDMQLWRKKVHSRITPPIVRQDILAFVADTLSAPISVTFVPNKESLSRNDSKIHSGGHGRKGRGSKRLSATVEEVFSSKSDHTRKQISSIYTKGRSKGFQLSQEERDRIAQEAIKDAATITGTQPIQPISRQQSSNSRRGSCGSSSGAVVLLHKDNESTVSGPGRADSADESRGGQSVRSFRNAEAEPVPDMIHPVGVQSSVGYPAYEGPGYYYCPPPPPYTTWLWVSGLPVQNVPEKSEELVDGSMTWAYSGPIPEEAEAYWMEVYAQQQQQYWYTPSAMSPPARMN